MIKKFDQDIDSSDLDGFEGLVKKLAEDKDDQKSIIVFFDALAPRVLHDAQPTDVPQGGSLMFQNMTPLALSGLFVAVFLIVVLLIALSCLFDIKTNDKFARQNLWVGKES